VGQIAEGGRGKKTLDQNSDPGFSSRDLSAKNANSTVGQIAEAAKVGRHKAAQAVDVAKHVPEFLDEVIAARGRKEGPRAQADKATPARLCL
jgi:hypothetical protein